MEEPPFYLGKRSPPSQLVTYLMKYALHGVPERSRYAGQVKDSYKYLPQRTGRYIAQRAHLGDIAREHGDSAMSLRDALSMQRQRRTISQSSACAFALVAYSET